MDGWVDAAQIASGFAALAAVGLSAATVRSARRVPLTDSYMGAWQAILDVLAVATDGRPEPPPEHEADRLMRQYVAADHRLSVIEATLEVRVYGREIRGDLKNLLIDTLYDDPEVRRPSDHPLTAADLPREPWANCTDAEWVRVINSVPFASMLASQVWDIPGPAGRSDHNGLMRWYFPVVLSSLDHPGSVTSTSAEPQRQLAFMLGAYVDAFLLPWIRDASREALLGRLDRAGRRTLWRRTLRHWRRSLPWKRRPPRAPGLTLFEPTRQRR